MTVEKLWPRQIISEGEAGMIAVAMNRADKAIEVMAAKARFALKNIMKLPCEWLSDGAKPADTRSFAKDVPIQKLRQIRHFAASPRAWVKYLILNIGEFC